MAKVDIFGGGPEWRELNNAAAHAWREKVERLGPSELPHPQEMAERAERIAS